MINIFKQRWSSPLTVSESKLKIKLMLRWTFFEILHMPAVLCEKKPLHEYKIVREYLWNYKIMTSTKAILESP